MAKFKNMEDVAEFLVKDYRFQNLLSSIWGNDVDDYGEEEVKDAAAEVAETWDYVKEKNNARWGVSDEDESLRQVLSDWYAEQLLYEECDEVEEDEDAEPAYVMKKRAEYTAAKMVYQIYKEV